MTTAHRRATDRVRSERSSRDRIERGGHREREVDVDDAGERMRDGLLRLGNAREVSQ